MNEKLVISVLGNRNSGKSYTWNALFGRAVRTGRRMRRLYLRTSEYVEVFVVSGSPEERHTYVGRIVGRRKPSIILCSIQYSADATQTVDYFLQNGYSLYTHWLNPGFRDLTRQRDSLALTSYLLDRGGVLAIRNAKTDLSDRVQELRDYLYGWARNRNLLLT
jgi:hypothetical protein